VTEEQERYRSGTKRADLYARQLRAHDAAVKARASATEVFRAEDLPWEDTPQGRMKHLAHRDMGGALASCDAFILEIPAGGRSGRHRHFAEEYIYVLEGSGQDHHWDPQPVVAESGYSWPRPEGDPTSTWEWAAGDSIFIPPMTAHQHVNGDPASRVYETLGFGGIEQLDEVEPIP